MKPLDHPVLLEGLPVFEARSELAQALDSHHSAVLVAPPGTGKTTAVPLLLLQAPWLANRKILLLSPRRLATRAAAERMAHLLGRPLGQLVGYRMRMDSRVGPQTRIEVITEGVLTRMLQSDPSLEGVGLVIFDEFHERSLDADLGLALCLEVQAALNPSLRLLVMSATLDPAPVVDLLNKAPLIQCESRAFPVDTRYIRPKPSTVIEQSVADVVRKSAAVDEGSILVFLPGAPEIHRTARLLADAGLHSKWEVAPLFGNLTRREQDAAIAAPPDGRRKIVLATSIAETSLTIEGIRVVVDSGLQRTPRFDPRTGMTRLATLPVSKASADQRRGRAGRLGPGICYRLWGREIHSTLAPSNRPEILETDLAALCLESALWGTPSAAALTWLDPPPTAAVQQAEALLKELEAIDDQGKITDHGRRMARLPLHPRLAHMVMAARQDGLEDPACLLAALLSERNPIRFQRGAKDADLALRIDLLQAFMAGKALHVPDAQVDAGGLGRIKKTAAMLQAHLNRLNMDPSQRQRHNTSWPGHTGRLLAWAYPDRIARRRPQSTDRYVLANGRGACFTSPDPLSTQNYIVIAELDGDNREARIFSAAAIDEVTLFDQFGRQMQWRERIEWDDDRQAVAAERTLSLGAIMLKVESLKSPPTDTVTTAMIAGIRSKGIDVLPWTPALRSFQSRVLLVNTYSTEEDKWPDLSDQALLADLENWLAPYLNGITSFKALNGLNLHSALTNRLTWHQQKRLDQWAPTHITVPSGSRRLIDYGSRPPVLAVRLQEMFGSDQTPAILNGRLPLTLHLLSPAGRPTQITQDLAGFWRTSYAAVKKELKGRYPKHYWPDDPANAQATSRAKPRQK